MQPAAAPGRNARVAGRDKLTEPAEGYRVVGRWPASIFHPPTGRFKVRGPPPAGSPPNYTSSRGLVRFSRLLAIPLLLLAAQADAQEPVRDTVARRADLDSVRPLSAPGLRLRTQANPLSLARPAALMPAGRLTVVRPPADALAVAQAEALQARMRARVDALWGQRTNALFGPESPTAGEQAAAGVEGPSPDPATAGVTGAVGQVPPVAGGVVTADGPAQPGAPDGAGVAPPVIPSVFGEYADLGLQLNARIETKGERNRNERCSASEILLPTSNCRGAFQPQFDFQFGVRTGGVVADRIHVNVDYDSQREFDASNNISVYYDGKSDEMLHRLEVGNVSFAPPASRFITGGIPSGNYGLQAIGQIGPMRFRTIVAQQKGNVVKDQVYSVGDRTVQTLDKAVEDYQVEARRFFWTVDPRQFAGYPNIDMLDAQAMNRAAASLPAEVRPTRMFVYRLQFTSPPSDPSGPQFRLIGDTASRRGEVYQRLQEGVDYYIDPSQLWIALVRPLTLNQERLVVAYEVQGGQRSPAGGTPDLVYTPGDQFANLVWDPSIRPGDPAFFREIRSVYRVGGDDIRRNSIAVRVVAGNSGELEKPLGGTAQTFLEMFGLAQRNNASTFDLENRLWPRPTDANRNPQSGNPTIRDYFLVFPSMRPFSDTGLVQAGNPVNEELYRTPGEDLYSSRRPQTIYQILLRYQAEGGGEGGTLALGSVQVRPNSERIMLDGRELVRGNDYTVDYELGRVTFNGADTLFYTPRQVQVRYEENPLFAEAPTSIFGLATEFPFQNGQVNFTAISQAQKTTFNRPPLGFEPASSLVAGVNGNFTFEAEALSRAVERLPFVGATTLSRINLQGELATSRPQPNAAGQAYVESFEGEGGINIGLNDLLWYYSSQPAAGVGISDAVLDTTYASTMAWQSTPFSAATGQPLRFTIDRIDPSVRTQGTGIQQPEQMLWLTLFPLHRGNLRTHGAWTINRAPAPLGTRRWRSIRTPLSATGVDLSRVEEIEFWTYIDTRDGFRQANPRLVLDFGDISENTLVFGPDTMVLGPSSRPDATVDTLYFGRRVQGYDRFDTERDSITRSFQVERNDIGLPGDRIVEPMIQYTVGGGTALPVTDVAICRGEIGTFYELGDTRANCTVGNNRLDEEDLNANFNLDIRRGDEAIRRYVVDLSQQSTYARTGVCNTERDSTGVTVRERCWVHIRVPFGSVGDGRDIGSPQIRRIKAMRVTMISGDGVGDSAFTTVPIARLKLLGSPWLKRNEQAVAGIAGERPVGGIVAATIVSTTDSASLGYIPPPGVVEGLDSKTQGLTPTGPIQVNERSLRLLASELDVNERAEAYYRFPEGQKSFMGYKEMRLWARGRGNGWGENGDLQFFVKVGRDANNFYLYRTPVNAGMGQAPWLPEVRVDFQRFFALRAEIQNSYLQGGADSLGTCSDIDLAIIGASDRREGTRRYAACADGYMVYTIDPNTSAPNLAAVQEMAVGMIRVANTGGITGGDTLELWVDDVRLTNVENTPGYAGQFDLGVVAGDVANFRVNLSRQDPHFRQLAEQPTFLSNDVMDVNAAVRLERLLPQAIGLALPFTVSHARRGTDPLYLSRSDVRGDGIEGLRTPASNATAMSLDIRRVAPISHPVLGPLLNHVGMTTRYAFGESQSEYRQGRSTNYQVGVNYNLASRSQTHRLPGWLDRVTGALPEWIENSVPIRSLRTADYRIMPTAIRFTSDVQRSADRSLSYLKPATVFDGSDEPRVVHGLSHVWRNASALELRPVNAIALRWDVNSLRDLRDYGGATPSAIVAGFERDRLLGMDVGLERERTMGAGISFSPSVATWFRPRADFGTSFVMARDPNALEPLRTGGDPDGELRLPRRLNNGQTFSTGFTMDVGRAMVIYAGDSSIARRLADYFLPVDVSYSRSLASAFDGTATDAPLSYQFGLGGVGDFRAIDDELAASANRSQNLSASGSMRLPYGMTVSNRYLRTDSRLWTRRQPVDAEAFHGRVDNSSTTFPDARLSWNYRPRRLRTVLSAVGANLAVAHSEDRSFRPRETLEGTDDLQTTDTWKYPVSGSLTWALLGGFSTSGGFSTGTSERTEPGGTRRLSTTRDMSVDFAKRFNTPESWGFRNGLRTRLAFQEGRSRNVLLDQATNIERQLARSGRYAFNLNADTELSDDLTFTVTGARVITYDKQNNRRFEQTILSMVFNLTFFAGELTGGP